MSTLSSGKPQNHGNGEEILSGNRYAPGAAGCDYTMEFDCAAPVTANVCQHHFTEENATMAIAKTDKIWHNGKLVNWDDAQIHIMSHVVNYGSSVFDGVRCYSHPSGPAIFRAREHAQRLIDSAKIYRMDTTYTADDIVEAMVETVGHNGVWPCYIRPLIFRGYGEAGVNPFNCPVEVYIANYAWGKYLGHDSAGGYEGVDVCVSSWTRLAPNTLPALAKAGANYANSQLIKMEAIVNGYVEGIALDVNGYVSEGSGENLFVVRDGVIYTAPLGNSVLQGITRASVIQLAQDQGLKVVEQIIPREMLYIADELFFTGTAAEITPIRSVDKITVGTGKVGPVATALMDDFFGIVKGQMEDRHNWFTPVPVKQTVGA
jgi:branched-chain amino acid aminotransferase